LITCIQIVRKEDQEDLEVVTVENREENTNDEAPRPNSDGRTRLVEADPNIGDRKVFEAGADDEKTKSAGKGTESGIDNNADEGNIGPQCPTS
jgi:hypothetical protein